MSNAKADVVMHQDFPVCHGGSAEPTVTILPVPYDGTSTYIKGSDQGPQALLNASPYLELWEHETDTEPFKLGITVAEPVVENASPEEMTEAVYRRTHDLLEKKQFVVLLGGEHSVSFGSIRAHAKKYPGLSVLQLDAHTDLRDEYHGSKHNHACAMARAREVCAKVVQVGIRSMDISERHYLREGNIFLAEDVVGKRERIPQIIDQLGEQVYISFDLDAFDPSIMRATGTPEPGGLAWYDALAILRAVARKKQVVGFDIVELCPMQNTQADEFMAAKLLYKLLAYVFEDDERIRCESRQM